MSTGSDEDRGRNRYGRRRGARYELSEDEESASSYLSDSVVDNTLAPHGDTDKDAIPLCERGDRVAPPPTTPPTGTGSLLLEELEPSGPAHRDHGAGPPLQPELPPSRPCPPCSRVPSLSTTGRESRPTSEVVSGLPLGTGAVQDWVLSNAARQACLVQEETTPAHTEALPTAEAALAKTATSYAAAQRRARAAAEERSRVMREWEEGDRARSAEVEAAARTSHEADAAVQRAKRVLAKPGDKRRRSGRVPAASAAVAPYSSGLPAVPAAGTPYKTPGCYLAAVAAEAPAQALGPYHVAQPTPRPSFLSA